MPKRSFRKSRRVRSPRRSSRRSPRRSTRRVRRSRRVVKRKSQMGGLRFLDVVPVPSRKMTMTGPISISDKAVRLHTLQKQKMLNQTAINALIKLVTASDCNQYFTTLPDEYKSSSDANPLYEIKNRSISSDGEMAIYGVKKKILEKVDMVVKNYTGGDGNAGILAIYKLAHSVLDETTTEAQLKTAREENEVLQEIIDIIQSMYN